MAFGGGDGVRYPSPLSGGSKLNNLTCVVGKKKIGHLRLQQQQFYQQFWAERIRQVTLIDTGFFRAEDVRVREVRPLLPLS